jgi:hypothetical protein
MHSHNHRYNLHPKSATIQILDLGGLEAQISYMACQDITKSSDLAGKAIEKNGLDNTS